MSRTSDRLPLRATVAQAARALADVRDQGPPPARTTAEAFGHAFTQRFCSARTKSAVPTMMNRTNNPPMIARFTPAGSRGISTRSGWTA
jgi:hypothetical protein